MEADRLTKFDLFASLPDEQLQKLAGTVNEWSAEDGDQVIQSGDSSFQLFAVEDGSVEVTRDDETIATLGSGEVVGEIGVAKRGLAA